ncbi:MAG: tRNA pseudouridine(55) synthase TruB [Candidatus Omnitrophica bacterium]|nr:tRNA pseudouridine(55) synthase TruB [Candidatus Omnitrophota bacterium]
MHACLRDGRGRREGPFRSRKGLATMMIADGILVADKEKGMTSHDVVSLVRRRYRLKKVGHAGTLDPNATGVLVLLLGKATKLSGTFLNEDKEYIATMKLGENTSTGDSEGEVTAAGEVSCSPEEAAAAVSAFRGEMDQVPPMVSAKKIGGKKLYKLARKGIEVKREPRKIFISEMEVLEVSIPVVVFRTVCSKGTYIRQLAQDIGTQLGCGAHLAELRRIRSGSFGIDRAVPVSVLKRIGPEELNEKIIRV